MTSKEFADQVVGVAAGLIAAGIEPGDRIALLSATRFEWLLADFAIWTAGAVTVPIYATSSVEQVRWILSDSGAIALFAENGELAALAEEAGVESVRQVWRFDTGAMDELRSAGARLPLGLVEERRRSLKASSLATIVYTSGTTGQPKGCMLDHGSLVAETRNVARARGIYDHVLNERSSILLFLPLAHILARVIQLCAVHAGAYLGHLGDISQVQAELAAFQPTLVLAVPRVFEKVAATARHKAAAEGHEKLLRAAEETAVAYSKAADGRGPSVALRLRHLLFDRLVYATLRAALGGRVVYAVSGGAPLSVELGHLFRGIGINILEGWGLTETTAGVTFNLPSAQRVGSTGQPLPGCAVRIAPDGEILASGRTVFAGYWQNPEATSEVFEDGWLRTGDLGHLDSEGFLYITGRKKDVIVTASGKNVAPAPLEDRLREHWLIEECVVVGDQRPYVGVLVTLDVAIFGQWKETHGKPAEATISELRADPDLLSVIQEGVDRANEAVSRAEAIKRFRILDSQFSVGAELTPTQKVRRSFVLSKFAAEVDELYSRLGG